MLGLTNEEQSQLLYELNYRYGELLGGGDTEQAFKLAGIIDKLKAGKVVEDLKSAIEYESKNLDENSFTHEEQYQWAVGHADGLSDALGIIQGEDWKEVIDYETE